jgi:integrase
MRLLTNGGESFLSHPHMLRHACGFALADQGADTRLIQHCLGNRGGTLPFMSVIGKTHTIPQSGVSRS